MHRPERQLPVDLPAFYASPPHPCSYLPGQIAVSVFADPDAEITTGHYGLLSDFGFRRSGPHLYRPGCEACTACIPIRVPAAAFTPNRAQRRNSQRNAGLHVYETPLSLTEEYFDLYLHYMQWRHPGSSMDNVDPAHFAAAFDSGWCDTVQMNFRLDGVLVAVAIADRLAGGLSAVYTYFDPDHAARGLGTYAIIRQIEAVRDASLDWLYLGYWIEASDKMRYKSRYSPHERFENGAWSRFS
jgi:arginine-tRNA-protein transferase